MTPKSWLRIPMAVVLAATAIGCAPSYEVWSSSTVRVTVEPGSSQCDMQSLQFIRWDGKAYVRDPEGIVPVGVREGAFEDAVSLPADANDTGLRNGDRSIWEAGDQTALYVVKDQLAERWPEVERGYGCD